jgi:spermidine synthase
LKEPNYTYKEYHSETSGIFFTVRDILHSEETPFQRIDVVRTERFGKVLLLDGLVMLTERDEFVYHEMLTHPALLAHPAPKDVLIVGGGDGGTLREVLKHDVERVTLVEIDRRVCEVSREHFPGLASGFKDSRARILYEDGIRFVRETGESFDVVLVDSTDPVDHAEKLFGPEFYADVKSRLRPDGALVTQTESPVHHLEFIGKTCRLLSGQFRRVALYLASIPTYPGGVWSFTFASDSLDPLTVHRDPPEGLEYYNPGIHRASFALPTYLSHVL